MYFKSVSLHRKQCDEKFIENTDINFSIACYARKLYGSPPFSHLDPKSIHDPKSNHTPPTVDRSFKFIGAFIRFA